MREGILTIDQQMLTAPDPASDLMPVNTDSFWEGLLEILTEALPQIMPSMSECLKVCLSVLAVVLLLSILETLPGNSKRAADLAGCAAIGMLLLRPANSLIQLGVEMIQSVSEYCKLLLPVMTAALAGSGGTTTSAALYAGTAVFDALSEIPCRVSSDPHEWCNDSGHCLNARLGEIYIPVKKPDTHN